MFLHYCGLRLFVGAVVVLSVISLGDALKCRECEGEDGGKCGPDVKDAKDQTCSDGQLCYKAKLEIEGKTKWMRGCQSKEICTKEGEGIKIVTCDTCEKDLCNYASRNYPMALLVVVAVAGYLVAR